MIPLDVILLLIVCFLFLIGLELSYVVSELRKTNKSIELLINGAVVENTLSPVEPFVVSDLGSDPYNDAMNNEFNPEKRTKTT